MNWKTALVVAASFVSLSQAVLSPAVAQGLKVFTPRTNEFTSILPTPVQITTVNGSADNGTIYSGTTGKGSKIMVASIATGNVEARKAQFFGTMEQQVKESYQQKGLVPTLTPEEVSGNGWKGTLTSLMNAGSKAGGYLEATSSNGQGAYFLYATDSNERLLNAFFKGFSIHETFIKESHPSSDLQIFDIAQKMSWLIWVVVALSPFILIWLSKKMKSS